MLVLVPHITDAARHGTDIMGIGGPGQPSVPGHLAMSMLDRATMCPDFTRLISHMLLPKRLQTFSELDI